MQLTIKNHIWKAIQIFSLMICMAGAQSATFQFRTFKGTAPFTLPYRLLVPSNYDAKLSYPVVLAMHGLGERGNDNEAPLKANDLGNVWARDTVQTKHPSFVIVPQCPGDSTWIRWNVPVDSAPITPTLKTVYELLDSLQHEYHIDVNRIYMVGLSMGGFATWDLVARYPQRFAAIVPIAGWGDTSKATLFKSLPIWAFHGNADNVILVAGTKNMIEAICKADKVLPHLKRTGQILVCCGLQGSP